MKLLRNDYIRIREYLDYLCGQRLLTEYEKRIIIDMSKKVLNSIAQKHPDIRKGVDDAMGGKVLDYEAKDILRQGIAQGLSQGLSQGRSEGETKKLISLVCKKLAKGKEIKEIAEVLEEKENIIAAICEAAAAHAPEYDIDAIYMDWKAGKLS